MHGYVCALSMLPLLPSQSVASHNAWLHRAEGEKSARASWNECPVAHKVQVTHILESSPCTVLRTGPEPGPISRRLALRQPQRKQSDVAIYMSTTVA